MTRAGSLNRHGTPVKRCRRPSSWSSSSACAGERFLALPGIRSTSMPVRYTSANSYNASGMSSSAGRSRPRHLRHRCSPDLCTAALKIRKRQQDANRVRAGTRWIETGLVFTTRHGTPIEPRNFNRSFDRCIRAARVPRIPVHGTRKTCTRLLVALDVRRPPSLWRSCCATVQQLRQAQGQAANRHTACVLL
jgi:integrase